MPRNKRVVEIALQDWEQAFQEKILSCQKELETHKKQPFFNASHNEKGPFFVRQSSALFGQYIGKIKYFISVCEGLIERDAAQGRLDERDCKALRAYCIDKKNFLLQELRLFQQEGCFDIQVMATLELNQLPQFTIRNISP